MAKKLSTGLRDALCGGLADLSGAIAITGTTYATTVTTNVLACSGNTLDFLQTGWKLNIAGFTDSQNNGLKTVGAVTVNGSQVVLTDGGLTTEAAGDSVTILVLNGLSFETLFDYAILEIYSGSQPTDADSAETGTKLVRITTSSGAVTPGTSTNGLRWGNPSSGIIAKSGTWSGTILATGTAGWFRLYTNNYITGASATAIRLDGSCGTSSAQLNLSSLSLVSGATLTIDTFTVTLLE